MAKKTDKPAAAGVTPPTQMRLKPDTLADLDLIAEARSQETGITHTRTDAVRFAAKREADRLRKRKADAE